MQALGFIETRGLLPAIECADVMLKTAEVELVGRTFVGGGLVTITVTGDVAAVTAAVEAGAKAARQVAHSSLVSQHIIPRPHPDIDSTVIQQAKPAKAQPISVVVHETAKPERTELAATTKESNDTEQITLKHLQKNEVDAFILNFGLEKGVQALQLLPVVKLRNLARAYEEIDIAGRAISKANKDLLIQKLTAYYERGSRQ